MSKPLAVLLGTSALLASTGAAAWDSPEHAAFGKFAIAAACAATPAIDACSTANQDFAGAAVAEPDHCHSYWFSATGIAVNDTDAVIRADCPIRAGTPLPYPSLARGYFDSIVYVLTTNANHFGDNTRAHFDLYHALALQAAQLGSQIATQTAPDASLTSPNPLAGVCTKTALGIEGFALHYLTDRTAAGHAWEPEPRYDRSNRKMDGMRSCFHGQPLLNRTATALLFNCVDFPGDSLVTSAHVLAGLGDVGRNFGGNQAGTGLWMSDSAFSPSVTAQADAAQKPSVDAFKEVLATLAGTPAPAPAWTDTFVSDHDFCAVALSECCRLSSTAGLGVCDTCLPDITDGNLQASCPVDKVVGGGVSGVDWVPLESHWNIVPLVYFAHLNFGAGGGNGISVARTLAHLATPATVHPDAAWDRDNSVVTRSGCAMFDITQAALPMAPLDGSAVTASITYEGNPTFPLAVHWRPNAACVAPSNIPSLCAPQDYPFPTAPNGTTALTPQPLGLSSWACNGATGSAAASTDGVLYITDANGSWTPAFAGTLQCGDVGDASSDGPSDSSSDVDASATPVASDFEGMVVTVAATAEFAASTMTLKNVLAVSGTYAGTFGGPEAGNPPLSTALPANALLFQFGDSAQLTGTLGFPPVFTGTNFANRFGRSNLIAVWKDVTGWKWAWNITGDSYNSNGGFPQWHEYQFVYDSRLATNKSRYDVYLGGNAMPGGWSYIRTLPTVTTVTRKLTGYTLPDSTMQ